MAILMLILMNIAVMASIYLSLFLIELIFHVKIDPQSVTGLTIINVTIPVVTIYYLMIKKRS